MKVDLLKREHIGVIQICKEQAIQTSFSRCLIASVSWLLFDTFVTLAHSST
jgi:hypothetical protein